MEPTLQDTQPLPYVPLHAFENLKARTARPRYSARAAFTSYIAIRERLIGRRGVEAGQHRADEGGE